MTDHDAWGDPEHTAALATLIALRAVVLNPQDGADGQYLMLPTFAMLDVEGAIEHLVTLPKPVSCVGLAAGGILAIGYWPVPEAYRDVMPDRRDLMRGLREEYWRSVRSPRVLLFGYQESLVLNLDDLEAWAATYDLPLTSHVINDRDREARDQGATAGMRFFGIIDGEGTTEGTITGE